MTEIEFSVEDRENVGGSILAGKGSIYILILMHSDKRQKLSHSLLDLFRWFILL